MMPGGLSPLEHEVIAMLLSPDHPVFEALRLQFARCEAAARELTGVGFFTELSIPTDAAPAPVRPARLHLGGVVAEIDGLKHGAGFVLFIENGMLATLEGYSYDEPWPERVNSFSLLPRTRSEGNNDLQRVERAFDRRPDASGGDIGAR
jgi:hypothetical protein